MVDDLDAEDVSEEHMSNAGTLVRWYLDEAGAVSMRSSSATLYRPPGSSIACTPPRAKLSREEPDAGNWHAGSLRLQQAGRMDPKLLVADTVLKFIEATGQDETRVRDIYQRGPSSVRNVAAAREAVRTLIDHGLIVEVSERPHVVRLVK